MVEVYVTEHQKCAAMRKSCNIKIDWGIEFVRPRLKISCEYWV